MPNPSNKKPVDRTRQKHIKDKLKMAGHPTGKIDGLKLDTEDDVLAAMCELHSLSVDDYRRLVH